MAHNCASSITMPVDSASNRSVGSKCDSAEGRLCSMATAHLPRHASPGGEGQRCGFFGANTEVCRTWNVELEVVQTGCPVGSWTTASTECVPRSIGSILNECWEPARSVSG